MLDAIKNRTMLFIASCCVATVAAGCGSGPRNSSLLSLPASPANVQMDSEAAAMGQAPTPSTARPAVSGTPSPIRIQYGGTVGLDDTFSPVNGDTSAGGNGDTVDGIPCDNGAIPYHIHAHVSLLVDGKRLAVPDAIGLHNPRLEDNNGLTYATLCYYHLHTHDATGLIHAEGPAQTVFTLGQLFAVWGQPLSSTNVAGHTGAVQAYVASAKSPGWSQQTGPYTMYSGDLQALPIASHEEIVLEVGPTFVDPAHLQAIVFPTYQ